MWNMIHWDKQLNTVKTEWMNFVVEKAHIKNVNEKTNVVFARAQERAKEYLCVCVCALDMSLIKGSRI